VSRPQVAAALVLALALPAPAGARASDLKPGALYEAGPSGRYLLGGRWLLRLDPGDTGLAAKWQRGASASGWQPVRVPNAWNATDLSPASQAGGIGWYRRDFRLPHASTALRWIVRFESVNYRARVWLNGRPLGSHTGAFLPFELPMSRVRPTGVNRLVVRVDSRRGPFDLPPSEDTRSGAPGGGWWNDSGILREVYVRSVDRGDMTNVLVRPKLGCAGCPASILVRTSVRNVSDSSRTFSLSGRFGTQRLSLAPVSVPSGASRPATAIVTIPRPRLWSPDHPTLYSLRLNLRQSGKLLQTYRLRTGLRKLEVRHGLVYLNGHRIALRGASVHEDDPRTGAAIGPRQRIEDILRLKRLHATATRAHYPLHPQTLELADRKGILVWSQIPVYQLSAAALNRAEVRNRGLRMLDGMILRDRNHPSVLAWSVGNELPSRPNRGQSAYIRKAVSHAKALDPQGLVALDVAGYPSVPAIGSYRRLDAIGLNDYFGWYPGPNGQILAREALPAYLDRMRRLYPRQGLFVTEFGAEANRHGPIDEKGTYEFQLDFLRYHLQAIASRPFIAGAIMWLLRDFRVRPDWDGGNPRPNPPFNEKGILDRRGRPKPAYSVVARIFKRTRQIR
jgi:beta-glucuronidase